MSKYTPERFFGGIGDDVMSYHLQMAMSTGYQLHVAALDYQALPVVLILACYGLNFQGAEIVDDYDGLIAGYREAIRPPGGLTAHPDLFMASCISLLHDRGEHPSLDAFYSIGVPELFNELIMAEESADEGD